MTPDFSGKRIAVLGLGISNSPLIGYLLERGASVTARDRKPFDELPEAVRAYSGRGVSFVCGDGYLDGIDADIIFKSPGIRYDKPQLTEAASKGTVITSEMELFFELCPAKIIGVTGSDGKTTSTTLIYKALEAQYGSDKVFVGGNIGAPLLPVVDKMTSDCFAVVELSSFQLHTMRRSPDISLITNISPNHLDYHRDMAEYIDAKSNIFRFQKPGSRLVLNAANPHTASLAGKANKDVETIMFGGSPADNTGVYELDGGIYDGISRILDVSDIILPGHHNVENYMGAIAALRGIVGSEVFRSLARTFPGVEHRCELVRELDGVKFYNSSIDSSPTRTSAALYSFKDKVIVICGGYDKHIPFEPLAKPLCDKAKTVVLTGATADKIYSALTSSPDYRPGNPEIIREPDFHRAVIAASNCASSGDCVILSPACASFDAFPNFEVRGKTFKSIINSL